MITSKNIFIIAGEASGDQHAANYVKQHLKINPDIKFTAIGQQELKKEGAKIIYDSEKISVVGIIEVLVKYRLIKHALNIAYKHIKEDKPDYTILFAWNHKNEILELIDEKSKDHQVIANLVIGSKSGIVDNISKGCATNSLGFCLIFFIISSLIFSLSFNPSAMAAET